MAGEKSPEMEAFLKSLMPERGTGFCPFCKNPVVMDEFKDELSLREFQISGMCQTCQDEIFI